MNTNPINFTTAYNALTGHRPFPWQEKMFQELIAGNIPSHVSLPTGAGKTSLMAIWLLALAAQAQNFKVVLPRRLVWVVDRRTVVDQATDEAGKILERLLNNEDLTDYRKALASLSYMGWRGDRPVVVSTLRGKLADNKEWKRDPTRPAIIVGTVDMIGSKLMFSGYGDGMYLRAYHAGLLGQDTWMVLDEAHLSPAFAQLLQGVSAFQENSLKPFRATLVSATLGPNGNGGNIFTLSNEDQGNDILRRRLTAPKWLTIHQVKAQKTENNEWVKKAVELALQYKNDKARVIIYVEYPDVAEKIRQHLARKIPVERIQLLTGTLRNFERDKLAENEVFRGFYADPNRKAPKETHYLISTSAGEVGANLDGDHMISDIVTMERLAQRLGRLNRLGQCPRSEVHLIVHAFEKKKANEEAPEKEKKEKDTREKRLKKTLEYLRSLPKNENDEYDVSVSALLANPIPAGAFEEPPVIFTLSRHLLDMWSLTTIRDKDWPGRPEVAPWLHGETEEDIPEVWIAWRSDVDILATERVSEEAVEKVFELYPLRPHELMQVPVTKALEKLNELVFGPKKRSKEAGPEEAEAPEELEEKDKEEESEESEGQEKGQREEMPLLVLSPDGSLRWRGKAKDLFKATNGGKVDLRYCTVVLPPSIGGLAPTGILDPSVTDPATDVAEAYNDRKKFWARPKGGFWATSSDAWETEEAVVGSTLNGLISALQRKYGLRLLFDLKLNGNWEEEDEVGEEHLLYFESVKAPEIKINGGVNGEVQELEEHNRRVQKVAGELAELLALPEDIREALRTAGGAHDLGKGRKIWQLAAGNLNLEKPLAKSPVGSFKYHLLNRYRHEFGSLVDLNGSSGDLVLHLVAAHHGHARPHFEKRATGQEQSVKERTKIIAEVMDRFARLQRQYGWWSLAWLESILKAADALVSEGDFRFGSRRGR